MKKLILFLFFIFSRCIFEYFTFYKKLIDFVYIIALLEAVADERLMVFTDKLGRVHFNQKLILK
jgi:glucan phosphoethanolaminetransferase (alkaline phosphatase superfamily)